MAHGALSAAGSSATIMGHSLSTTAIDGAAAIDATTPVNATTIHCAATIISRRTWRIRVVAAGLSVAAGGAVPQPAANHTSPIDRTASINRPASVNGAPSVDRPASVSPAAPSSDSRYQRFAVGDVDDDRMRLHRRRDGLRRLREQKRSGRCRCQRDRSHDFVHLFNSLTRHREPIVSHGPKAPSPCMTRHFANRILDLDQLASNNLLVLSMCVRRRPRSG